MVVNSIYPDGRSLALVRIDLLYIDIFFADLLEVDGQERGKATARSTKNAKEEAAKAALLSLGWACKSTPLRLIVKLNA